MTAKEAIEILRDLLCEAEKEKQEISKHLKYFEEERQRVENALDALKMGIGALELCEEAKERS